MAVSLRCPECQATLGKDVENSVQAYCSECGHEFYNERGYKDDSVEEKEFIRKHRPKPRFLSNGRLITSRVININKKPWE